MWARILNMWAWGPMGPQRPGGPHVPMGPQGSMSPKAHPQIPCITHPGIPWEPTLRSQGYYPQMLLVRSALLKGIRAFLLMRKTFLPIETASLIITMHLIGANCLFHPVENFQSQLHSVLWELRNKFYAQKFYHLANGGVTGIFSGRVKN